MRKILLLIFIVFFSSGFLNAQINSFLQKEPWAMLWNGDEGNSPNDPGWFHQYYEMKKNAEGEIPRLPYEAILQQRLNSTSRSPLLYNIQELGPKNYGGRTRGILLDRDNPDNLFVGSVSGGLWHSADSGAHWTAVNDQMSCLSISSITQDFYNHDIIYAGTGEGWGNGDGVIGNGVYRSNDHGVTFQQLPSTDGNEFNYIDRVEASPSDTGWLYVATAAGGLFRSKDFGDTLKKIFATSAAINDIEITPSGGVWIAVHHTAIYYSPSGDSGTFVAKMNGMPDNGSFRRIEMAIAPSDTTIIYAAFENSTYNGLQGMYRTHDFGQTWQTIGNPDSNFHFYTSQSWYSMCIIVKPDEPNFIVFGIGDLVYSTDGGIIWKQCLNLHADHHVLAWNPVHTTRFYLGEDGGFYRFRTDQMIYSNKNLDSSYSTIQYYAGCYFPTGNSAYAGSQDNGTHYCKEGDGNCLPIFGGDGAYCQVNQQYPTVSYASYQNGAIYRADDAYLDYPTFYYIANEMDPDYFEGIDEGAWFINPFQIDLVNGDYLGFPTTKRLWQTLDGGHSWQPAMNLIPGGSPYAVGISRSFDPIVYVGGSSAIFYRIDNAYNAYPGAEVNLCSKVPLSITSDFISCITVHPNDSSICYFSCSNYSMEPRVWKVTKGTTTPVFTPINGDLPVNLPVNYIDVDPARPDSFFLAGTDLGLYISDDAGNHWHYIEEFPNVVVEEVKVRPWDRHVFIFTHGRGMWTATLAPFGIGISNVNQEPLHAMIFPNPCSDELHVKSETNNVAVTIRDLNNRIVIPGQIISGEAVIDVSSLAKGTYLVEMKSDKEAVIKKVVKAE